jgi:hypothetical protein
VFVYTAVQYQRPVNVCSAAGLVIDRKILFLV